MEEKIYLIEDTCAYHKFYLNKANNKKEALNKFWEECNIDWKNEQDKKNGYAPRTKKQFEITDITKELGNKTIEID